MLVAAADALTDYGIAVRRLGLVTTVGVAGARNGHFTAVIRTALAFGAMPVEHAREAAAQWIALQTGVPAINVGIAGLVQWRRDLPTGRRAGRTRGARSARERETHADERRDALSP